MGFFYSIAVLRTLLRNYIEHGTLDYKDFNLIQDKRNLGTHKKKMI